MEDANEKKRIPPYVPYKTLINLFDGLKVGIPARIDRGVLGSSSGAVQAQIFSALKFLDLMSDKGIPTERLTRLVNSEGVERKSAFKETLTAAYPFLFNGEIDLKRITSLQLRELFVGAGASGETVQKCIAFFTNAANDNGIELSPHIGKVRSPNVRNGGSRPRKPTTDRQRFVAPTKDQGTERPPERDLSWNQLLLSKFPSFDPAWPAEVQVEWFKAFSELRADGQKDK